MRSFAKREEKDKKHIVIQNNFLGLITFVLFISVFIYIIVSNIKKIKN
jgi:hypothetical protein